MSGDDGLSPAAGRYAGLGYDPTPGERGAVESTLALLADGGGMLATLMDTLPPDAFFPQVLDNCALSMGRVANALITWLGQLADNKRQAAALDRVAWELKCRLREALAELTRAKARLEFADDPATRAAFDRAAVHEGWVRAQLDGVVQRAGTLRDKHLAQAKAATAGIAGPREPVGRVDPTVDVADELSVWVARAAFVSALVATGPAGWTAADVLAGAADSTAETSTLVLAADGVLAANGPAGTRHLAEALRSAGPKGVLEVVRAIRPRTFDLRWAETPAYSSPAARKSRS